MKKRIAGISIIALWSIVFLLNATESKVGQGNLQSKATEVNLQQNKIQRIGYMDLDFIFASLPDAKKMNSELKTFEQQLGQKCHSKLMEFQEQAQEVQEMEKDTTITDAEKEQKRENIQKIWIDLQKCEQDMNEKVNIKRISLLRPILDRIQKAAREVATKQGFTHVLNSNINGAMVLIYADAEYNISDLVLAVLKKQAAESVLEQGSQAGVKKQETVQKNQQKTVQKNQKPVNKSSIKK